MASSGQTLVPARVIPYGAITFDTNGDLYGTTLQGGAYYSGVVYKLTNQGSVFWHETVLYSFAGGRDGNAPIGVTLALMAASTV